MVRAAADGIDSEGARTGTSEIVDTVADLDWDAARRPSRLFRDPREPVLRRRFTGAEKETESDETERYNESARHDPCVTGRAVTLMNRAPGRAPGALQSLTTAAQFRGRSPAAAAL